MWRKALVGCFVCFSSKYYCEISRFNRFGFLLSCLGVIFSGVLCAEMHTRPILSSLSSWLVSLSAILLVEQSQTSVGDVLSSSSASLALHSSASWLHHQWLPQTIQCICCGGSLLASVLVRMDCWALLCQRSLSHAPNVDLLTLSTLLLLHWAWLHWRFWHITSVTGVYSAVQLLCQDL